MRSRLLVVLPVVLSLAWGGCDNSPALDTSEPWDLVWYSDSTGWGVAELWAERIEEEFGVEVQVYDHAKGVLPAVEILKSLGGMPDGGSDDFGRLGDTRHVVAEAEVIVVYGNPIDSGSTDDLEQCVTTSKAPRDPPTEYSSEDFEPYREILASIYEEIFTLVGDRPVIVRAIDSYNPVVADQEEAGVKEECIEAWEAWSTSIGEAASEFRVPMVSMYDKFNGTDHSEDPRLKGYILGDGQHTTTGGQSAMVEALHEVGYEPIDQ